MDDLTKLALAAQRGDRDALAAFVERSQADVWRFCAYLNGRDHADDLTQDTYSRALGALHRYRGEAPVRSWLLTIARRVCADQVRSSIRRRSLLERIRPTVDEFEASDSAAIDLWDLVAGLHPDRRSAFVLTQTMGLSYDEAAAVCGCPVGTIRSRVARARIDLVDRLSDPERQAESG